MTTGMKHLAAYQANLLDYNAAKDRACNYIGNQIRAARKSMKLSLEQLSQILMGYGVDIGRVAVNKWEKGISIPSAYQLLAVCAALHPGSIGRYRQCWRSAIWTCRSATCRYPLVQARFWTRETSKWSASRRAASRMVQSSGFGCPVTVWNRFITTVRSCGYSNVKHSVPAKLVS